MSNLPTVDVTKEVRLTLNQMAKQFQAVLPANVTPEKFIRVAMTAIQGTPKLLGCDRQTLYAAITLCAQDGLLPDGREAALVPYGNKVRYMPMVAGLCKRVRNSGEIGTIGAEVVHANDEYESWTDEDGPHFKFKRARVDRGEWQLAFAYAKTKDGFLYFEEMDRSEIEAIEKKSPANDSPWKGPFKGEMIRKTVLRRLAKYRLPSSADLDNALQSEDDIYDLKHSVPKSDEPKKKSRMDTIMDAQKDIPLDVEVQSEAADTIPI